MKAAAFQELLESVRDAGAYSLELSQHGTFDAGKMAYLAKPFDTLALSRTVRQVLSQPAA